MSFPLNLFLPALCVPALVSLLTLPLWSRWCQRAGLIDDPGHRKIHGAPVPLAGGLAVLTGLAVPIVVAALASMWNGSTPAVPFALSYGLNRRAVQLLAILLGAAGMTLLGLADDRWELRPGSKFAGQCLVAGLVVAAGVRITLFVPSAAFSWLVSVLWILTLTNAFNFMDNMNGLCAGLAAIAAWCFAVMAAVDGQYLVASLCLAIAGALLGFLPHNFPNARAFLGDAGSHLVGFLMAVVAILPHFYSARRPHALAVLSPLLVLAVPLADLVSVVWIRGRAGRPFYVGDTNHFSHRLVRAGCSRTKAVLLLWLAGALTGATAVLVFGR